MSLKSQIDQVIKNINNNERNGCNEKEHLPNFGSIKASYFFSLNSGSFSFPSNLLGIDTKPFMRPSNCFSFGLSSFTCTLIDSVWVVGVTCVACTTIFLLIDSAYLLILK